MSEQINRDVWDEPEMRIALAARDISAVYRRLRGYGVSQRQIAQLTGQSQSEVCEIVQGRKVMAYDVLVRIADGLGMPRGYLGLGGLKRSVHQPLLLALFQVPLPEF